MWRLRSNVRCLCLAHWKARSGLLSSGYCLAMCYGWGATNECGVKVAVIIESRSHWPTISETDDHRGWWLDRFVANFFSEKSILYGKRPVWILKPSLGLKATSADHLRLIKKTAVGILLKYCPPLAVLHLWPNLAHPAAQSICDSYTCLLYTSPSPRD